MSWLPAIVVLPYLVLMLWIYFKLLKAKPFKVLPSRSAFVSVIVACRNEELNIPLLLNDIACQDYPYELFEVLVVDDNSDDRTSEIVPKDSSGLDLKLISNNGRGKKEAIRTGVLNSSAELIITTDADCRMGKSWLRTIVSYYETSSIDMIICPVMTTSGKGFAGKFQELEFLGLQGITAGTALAGNPTMCNGANMAFSKASYLKNPGNLHFEINSGDDIFLLHSIKKQSGSEIAWLEANDAIVRTDPEKGLNSFMKQRKRWISKSTSYNDYFTIQLALVTFVTIAAQGILMFASMANHSLALSFLLVFTLKSIPDWLLIHSTAVRYNRKAVLAWFLPAQLVYPIYVFALLFWPVPAGRKKPSYPSQRGI